MLTFMIDHDVIVLLECKNVASVHVFFTFQPIKIKCISVGELIRNAFHYLLLV